MTSGMTQNEKSPVSPHDHTMSIAVNVAIPLKTDVVVLQPSGNSRSEKQASQYENTRTIQPRTGSPNRVKDTDLLVEHGRSHDSESFRIDVSATSGIHRSRPRSLPRTGSQPIFITTADAMAVVMPKTRMRRARQYPDDLMEQHKEVVQLLM